MARTQLRHLVLVLFIDSDFVRVAGVGKQGKVYSICSEPLSPLHLGTRDLLDVTFTVRRTINQLVQSLSFDFCIDQMMIAAHSPTLLAWDRRSGSPLSCLYYPKENRQLYRQIKKNHFDSDVYHRTGIHVDSQCAFLMVQSLLKEDSVFRAIRQKKAVIGPLASFLLYELTGKTDFLIDPTLAQQTQLYSIHDHCFDQNLCDYLNLPLTCLPQIHSHDQPFGYTRGFIPLENDIPIVSMRSFESTLYHAYPRFELSGCHLHFFADHCQVLYSAGQSPLVLDSPSMDQLAFSSDCYFVKQKINLPTWPSLSLGELSVYTSDFNTFNDDLFFFPDGSLIGLYQNPSLEQLTVSFLQSLIFSIKYALDINEQSGLFSARQYYLDGSLSTHLCAVAYFADILQHSVIEKPLYPDWLSGLLLSSKAPFLTASGIKKISAFQQTLAQTDPITSMSMYRPWFDLFENRAHNKLLGN